MDYFVITSYHLLCDVELKTHFYVIHFEESNILPDGYPSNEYESKGFVESTLIQDFPLRGKAVYLSVKKRRWRHKVDHTIIKRDFSFVADGAKFTKELSDFLKGRNPKS